jgi:hypothetical protein
MRDRASELRAIADGRLMLNVRNGVTVSRSMLAMIADEFEAMSTALAAKDAELAEVKAELFQSRNFWSEELSARNAQLAEANKALERIEDWAKRAAFPWITEIARRALEAQGGE